MLQDSSSGPLVPRLEWLKAYALEHAKDDPDDQCRALASGCLSLQHRLAERTLELMASPQGPGAWGGGSSPSSIAGTGVDLLGRGRAVKLPWGGKA